MKTLSNIRYLLFAVSLLGLFANFAQNEYGLDMLWFSDLFIALIFWTEAFVFFKRNWKESKRRALYLFNEHFWAGTFFMAWFFKFMHWPFANLMFVLAALFLCAQYVIYMVRAAIIEPRKGKMVAFLLVLFVLATISALGGLQFKTMHWPGAFILLRVSGLSLLAFIVIYFIRKPFYYDGVPVMFKNRLERVPGKMVMIFCYFSFWGLYTQLVAMDVLPGFYTLARPVALEKMITDKDERAETYNENYMNFLYNRIEAESRGEQ